MFQPVAASEIDQAVAALIMPEPQKAQVRQALNKHTLKIAWVNLSDSEAEDGDWVSVSSGGFNQSVRLFKDPLRVAVPVRPGRSYRRHRADRRGRKRHHRRRAFWRQYVQAEAPGQRRNDPGADPMTGGMWAGRLGIVIAIIIVAQASATFAYVLVCVAFVGAIGYFVYKGSYLPRFVMDVLDRLHQQVRAG